MKRDGFQGLYNGLNSSLLGIAVTNGCASLNFLFGLWPHVETRDYCVFRVYYYFYESTKGIIVRSRGGTQALSTLESVLVGLVAGSPICSSYLYHLFLEKGGIFAGSATTVISNPVWVIQTSQTVSGMDAVSEETSAPPQRRLGLFATAARLLHTGGPFAFFRGLGPALILVVNPVIQYTVFEQLKNALVRRRRMAGRVSRLLTDLDFFLLGAISKLGLSFRPFKVV